MDETNRSADDTILAGDDKIPKPARRNQTAQEATNEIGSKRPKRQGIVMIKALSVVVVAAFIAAGLTVLPGFAPKVEASVPVALAKSDRLDIHPVGRNCSEQAWPNFEPSCLRNAANRTATVRAARLVTAEHR